MRPYFFFSYARLDHRQDSDAFIDRFHADLCAELGNLEPAALTEASYRDRDRLILGDDWERELAGVLARCRTMVALYSPAYFGSLYCGKEWTAFHGRIRRHQELTGALIPALIPVLWEPPAGELPAEVAHIQYVEPAMSEAYARYGLRHLLRTDPMGPEYRKVVEVVAGRVRDAAARQLTALPAFALGAVRGYFPTRQLTSAMAPETAGLVRLFVAAGTSNSASPEGPRGGWYGPQPWTWAPYHPPTSPGIASAAQQVITTAGHATTLDVVSADLTRRLDEAREDNQVSILLVDPWVAPSEEYMAPLKEYDEQNHPVTGVMIPAGTSEPASGPERDALWTGVRQVFPRNWLRRSGPEQLFRIRVPKQDFADQLVIMVTVAQNKLMDDNFQWPDGNEAAEFGLDEGSRPPMPGLTIPAAPDDTADTAGTTDPPRALDPGTAEPPGQHHDPEGDDRVR